MWVFEAPSKMTGQARSCCAHICLPILGVLTGCCLDVSSLGGGSITDTTTGGPASTTGGSTGASTGSGSTNGGSASGGATSSGATTGQECVGIYCAAFYTCDPADGTCECDGKTCNSGNCDADSGACLAGCSDGPPSVITIEGNSPSLAVVLITAVLETPYDYQMLRCGGGFEVVWSNLTPLPPGMTLSSSGQFAGTPTALTDGGPFEFMVEAQEPPDGGRAFQNFLWTVEPAPPG